jgi:CRP-like cAMP-binding protein
MISPELLKRFDFFGRLNRDSLKAIAMIAEEEQVAQGSTLFEEKQPANAFYFLIEGYIDLYQRTFDTYYPKISKDLLVGSVHPREIFGLSAIVEPYLYNATGRTAQPSHFIKIDGPRLRALIDENSQLGCIFLRQISVALTERLMDTRVQLAAAWVDSQKQ